MGAVYEVVDVATTRRRALKVMLSSMAAQKSLRERFRREMLASAALDSEHVAELIDTGIDDVTGAPFMVMELLEGESMSELLRREGVLRPKDALLLVRQVAFVLDKASARGIVHRDVKPSNVFITRRDDGAYCAKLVDFGIAKLCRERFDSMTDGLIGTPLYMAPEQVSGDRAVGATDRYGLAQIAYTALVGEAYWLRASHAGVYGVLACISEGICVLPSSRALSSKGVTLPKGFDDWFIRATAISPEGRFPTAAVMVDALDRVLFPGEDDTKRVAAYVDDLPESSPMSTETRRVGLHPPRGVPAPSSLSPASRDVLPPTSAQGRCSFACAIAITSLVFALGASAIAGAVASGYLNPAKPSRAAAAEYGAPAGLRSGPTPPSQAPLLHRREGVRLIPLGPVER